MHKKFENISELGPKRAMLAHKYYMEVPALLRIRVKHTELS